MFTNKLELRYADALHDYDVYPKVVQAGKHSAITINNSFFFIFFTLPIYY